MIKSVTIKSEFSDGATFNIAEPPIYTTDSEGNIVWNSRSGGIDTLSNIFITEIEGLGPVKADINMTEIATMNGSIYNSSRAKSRDIIFHFLYLDINGLNAEEARQRTYTLFPLGRKVTLTFKTLYRTVKTEGYVESNEPEIFTEQAGAAITVNCPSAWFNVSGTGAEQEVEFSNLLSMFEFEFFDDIVENGEYVQDPNKKGTLVFTEIHHNDHHEFYYDGEVETGFNMTIIATAGFETPTIYNISTGEQMTIDTDVIEQYLRDHDKDTYIDISTGQEGNTGIVGGDEIRISTVEGNKYVKFFQAIENETTNQIAALTEDSDWLTIVPGNNIYSYKCANGSDLNVYFRIKAKVLVTGV